MAEPPSKAIMFDLGHTLIHFDGQLNNVLQKATQHLTKILIDSGLDLDGPDFEIKFLASLYKYYETRTVTQTETGSLGVLEQTLVDFLTHPVPSSVITAAIQSFFRITQQHWQVVQSAQPIISTLEKRGYRLGILSNASYDWDVQQLVDKAGIRPHLEFVLTSAKIGFRKPHPKVFREAVDAFKLPAAEISMVGDQLDTDIVGGKRAKMHTIFVTQYSQVNHNPVDVKPDRTIKKLDELLEIFPDF